MFNKFPTLETERLLLRELNVSDADDLFEIFGSEEVTKYYGMYVFKEIEEIKKMIRYFIDGFKEERQIRWCIVEKLSGKAIGTCGFHSISQLHFRVEIGYELSETYWGQGYMHEALQRIVKYGFEELNFMRIEGLIYPDNKASRKSLEKLGFKEEGLLRGYMYFRGEMTDLLMYSLLSKEYNKR